jgi:alkaline phosphatase
MKKIWIVLFASGLSVLANESPEQWYSDGQAAVKQALELERINGRAKNVILFVGDGMGVSTVTAARILEGQLKGKTGEENVLAFETLPYLALSKTYNTNQQTPDSAGTMTAIMTGVKSRAGVISVNQNAIRGDFKSALGNEEETFLEIAEKLGKSTGVVTTTRLTHATPAACYAHSPERNWESDNMLPAAAVSNEYPDIARQLIEFTHGDGLEVALGGGRRHFIPRTVNDGEGKKGKRKDGRDLTQEWLAKYSDSAYVWNEEQFNKIDVAETKHLLGLFDSADMKYEHDRPGDKGGEPSLSQMTRKAIEMLAQNDKGYFLMVEGGRIDHAHHASNAYRALTDTIEFSNAVRAALQLTDREETLIIVTADHSHVFTIAGYPARGNDILGKVAGPSGNPANDVLGRPYTTLGYANGPGYAVSPCVDVDCTDGHKRLRPDLRQIDTSAPGYRQESTVPLIKETHGAEDVAIYAQGPLAHLFHGTREQNYIFHVMLAAFGCQPD